MKAKTFSEIMKKRGGVSGIEKFNPYHDRLGRFASAGGSASFSANPNTKAGKLAIERESKKNPLVGAAFARDYSSTDVKDAIKEQSKTKNSLSGFIGADGKLTPEREALHKQIIDDILEGKTPVAGQAELRMMGGGPASGKSSALESGSVQLFDEKSSVTIDPDYMKTKLPGYKEMAKNDPGAASYYHEESSALAKRLYQVACNENYNVTYDGTGDGSAKSVESKINTARDKGYKVTGVYVTVDTNEAVKRNQARYDHAVAKGESPRLVPEEYVRNCHAKVTKISSDCASQFDSIQVFDNNGPRGSKPTLIATGGNGKGLTAVYGKEKEFASYMKKADILKGE